MQPLDEVLDSPAPAGVRLVAAGLLEDWQQTLPRLHQPEDTEALHDYRVALRKLRSWLKTFDEGGQKVQRRLADLNEATGGARDLEVMAQWLDGDTSAVATYALEHLKAQTPVNVEWLDQRTQKVALRLSERLSEYSLTVPLGKSASVVPFSWAYAIALRRLHQELSETALRTSGVEDAELLHKVRIRAKRLRYALAPLGNWPEVAEALKLLKERQDALGELHDRHAFEAALLRVLKTEPAPDIAAGLGALVARAGQEARELFGRYSQDLHQSDVRLAALVDLTAERLGKRLGLHLEVVPRS